MKKALMSNHQRFFCFYSQAGILYATGKLALPYFFRHLFGWGRDQVGEPGKIT
jgi:hypothetical protein